MKKLLIFLFVLFSFMLIPVKTNAKDKATIYLFRGKGCGYCRSLLTFLNSINDEYGDMYELKSYEVWNDQDNYQLMKDISEFLDEPASGVPYLIVGDQVFPGYASTYDSSIKLAIKDLYETKKSKRYDVMAEYKKKNAKFDVSKYKSLNFKEALNQEGIEYNKPKKKSSETSSSSVIIWNFVFTAVATSSIILFVNSKFNKLNEAISATNKATKTSKK